MAFTDEMELGRRLAVASFLADPWKWPVGYTPAQVINLGLRRLSERLLHAPRLLSEADVASRLRGALDAGKGFALLSIGDTEAYVLGQPAGRGLADYPFPVPIEAFRNAGYTVGSPEDFFRQQEVLWSAVIHADVVGIPVLRHFEAQAALINALERREIPARSIAWTDSTIAWPMLSRGWLRQLLHTDPKPTVILIGDQAPRLEQALVTQGIAVRGTLSPVRGLEDAPRVLETLASTAFDLALVAAGAASVPICAELARKQSKVALDIGKLADELALGFRRLDGSRNFKDEAFALKQTPFQTSISFATQAGYQDMLESLFPQTERLLLGVSAGECVNEGLASIAEQDKECLYLDPPHEVLRQFALCLDGGRGFAYVSLQHEEELHLLKSVARRPDVLGLDLEADALPTKVAATSLRACFGRHIPRLVTRDFVLAVPTVAPSLFELLATRHPKPRVALVVDGPSDFIHVASAQLAVRPTIRWAEEEPFPWDALSPGSVEAVLVSVGTRTPQLVCQLAHLVGRPVLDARDLTREITLAAPAHLRWLGLAKRRAGYS